MGSALPFLVTIAAVGATDIIDAGRSVGTSSNQVILGGLVVALIIVVLYRERQQNKQHEASLSAAERAEGKAEKAIGEAVGRSDKQAALFAQERLDLYSRMEKQTSLMDEERRQRWQMMIDVIRENTIAFRGCREAIDSLKQYLGDHTRV